MSNLPPYKIITSNRARKIRLQISARRGLELIVPLRSSLKHALKFLESKQRWVEKHLARISSQPNNLNFNEPLAIVLPKTLELKALQQIWEVVYRTDNTQNKVLTAADFDNRKLVIYGDISNKPICLGVLVRHLKNLANSHLIPLANELSLITNLRYSKIRIGSANTRWGSCSAKKNITLNYKLLYLDPKIVRYVIIHELCHLEHHNHGTDFWQLVNKHDNNWKNHRAQLRDERARHS